MKTNKKRELVVTVVFLVLIIAATCLEISLTLHQHGIGIQLFK